MDTSRRYRLFAEYEARGNSPCYERWCLGIADDRELVALIDQLPTDKRQPNLVLGAARYLGVEESLFLLFKDWMVVHWGAVREVALARSTQTNEVGRVAALLPVLSQLPGPLSLIEVGASAGLCLYPDRFSYHYGDDQDSIDPASGPSPVVLPCVTTGRPPLPAAVPTVVHRAGVDLNPLDVNDTDDMRWLECLVWPGQTNRLDRLRATAAIARQEPPHLVAGDLTDTIAGLVHDAPRDTTIVVFGSAVLNYLDLDARTSFEDTVRGLPCHWISNEGGGVITSVVDQLPKPISETRGQFVVTLDGRPLAYAGAHGQSLDWFASP